MNPLYIFCMFLSADTVQNLFPSDNGKNNLSDLKKKIEINLGLYLIFMLEEREFSLFLCNSEHLFLALFCSRF